MSSSGAATTEPLPARPRQVADHRKIGLRPEDTIWIGRDGRLVMRESDGHRRGRWRGAWTTSALIAVPVLLLGFVASRLENGGMTPGTWLTLVLSGGVPAALILALQWLCDPGDQWTLDRAGDSMLQIGQPVAKLSDVRALLVKGEWRRPKYLHKVGGGTVREVRHGAPRYEYAVMLETESGERVRIHRYTAGTVGAAVASLEAYLGLAAAWKGVPPGADPGAPPDEMLDED